MYFETDDLRQSYVVAKNEIVKFLRGKRIIVHIVITAIFFAMITAVVYYYREDIWAGGSEGVTTIYTIFLFLLLIIAATLFSSVTIVSEFEERTALVLFTRPIKKTPIFLGKLIGCLAIEMAVLVAYYVGMTIVSFFFNDVSSAILVSFGSATLYLLAASGIGMLMSSILKKASTATIITVLLLFLILPVASSVTGYFGNVDLWFMLDQASHAIEIYPPGALGVPEIDILRAAGVMVVWFIVPTILAWLAFIRREF